MQFSTSQRLDSMVSANILGASQITLQFNLKRNLDAAAQDVQTPITQAAAQLPQNMPIPPSFSKVNPADHPTLYLALGSKTPPLSHVDELAETFMSQPMSMGPTVSHL